MSDPDPLGPERVRRTLQGAYRAEPNGDPDPEHAHPVIRPELSRHVKIFTPRNRDVVRVILTEPKLTNLLLHRLDQRSEVCTKTVRYCYGCKLGLGVRWMGYVGAFLSITRVPVVLSLTPYALRCLTLGGPLPESLYRQRLRVCRASDSTRGKMWATRHGRDDGEVIGYEAHALPVLCRVYNLAALEVGLLDAEGARFLVDNPPDAAHDR